MQRDPNAAPLNPLPAAVWAIALPMIAMEVVLSLGAAGLVGGPDAIGWRLDAVQRFAYSPDYMRQMIDLHQYPLQGVMRLVTYPFVHLSFTHALFVLVILLALGKMVGDIFRWWAVLVVFFGSGIVGALVYTAIPTMKAPLIGGYPPVYGLIGAFTFLIWMRLAAQGANRFRAFTMIGFLLGAQLLFGLLFGGGWEWVADLAGFATGFLLSFIVSPGGWRQVVARLRQR
ncbi:rhomboid family intramembrane serine protease [Tabrizicola sp. J26]|uniref:rhomboid family intramembrane serine protease n=1 Tax=Alitabrizicola rongguiensis TaxID=2909234 RepID=UPI001F404705|nr:rhomboid family intramembrane serine protease [Tabrizicola rongguiensis]MCF1709157.1 rhomboid family intramembrane serine protease [Tabrizicola rongguiensis]